jgi:hypothetical protein
MSRRSTVLQGNAARQLGHHASRARLPGQVPGVLLLVTNLPLIPDLEHPRFGGRVGSTRLSSILEAADRDMEELAGGKDQLGSAVATPTIPSCPPASTDLVDRDVAAKRSSSFSNRFAFTPCLPATTSRSVAKGDPVVAPLLGLRVSGPGLYHQDPALDVERQEEGQHNERASRCD